MDKPCNECVGLKYNIGLKSTLPYIKNYHDVKVR